MHNNPTVATNLKIFLNLLIDTNLLVIILHWIFFSSSWKLIFDLLMFFAVRFFCTHIIAYRHPEGILWPETSMYSISNTSLEENQYQVSSYTGILTLAILYWLQEDKKFLVGFGALSLIASIFFELSYRISYCTDIFAAVLIAHLFSSLNKVWCGKLDKTILTSITEFWEKRARKSSN